MDFELAKKGREVLKMSLERDPTPEEMVGFAAVFNSNWLRGIADSILEKPANDTQIMGYAAAVECCLAESLDKLAMTDKAMEAASHFHLDVQQIVTVMTYAGSEFFDKVIMHVPSIYILTNPNLVHSLFMAMVEKLELKQELLGFMQKHPSASDAFSTLGVRIGLLAMLMKVFDMLDPDVLAQTLVRGPCHCLRCTDILAYVGFDTVAEHNEVFEKLNAQL